MSSDLKKGDEVEWNWSSGTIRGEVVKKITSPTDIKGHHANASKEDPQYIVRSDKTGKEAAHKPESLTKVDDG